MKILMLALGLCLATTVAAGERYNAMSGEWETAGSDESLRFNPMANESDILVPTCVATS